MKPLVVTYAHNAGGAAIVAAYVLANAKRYRFRCFVAGPALRVFKERGVKTAPSSKAKVFLSKHRPAFFLCGTSGPPRPELDLLRFCRERNIPSRAFLDHWVYYRERFGYPEKEWTKNLPNEIWVGDKEALRLAKRSFPKSVRLRYVPNPYLALIKKRYADLSKHEDSILFISEPVHVSHTSSKMTETHLLRLLLDHARSVWPELKIRVRLHPSEARDKYRILLKSHAGNPIRVTTAKQDLLTDFASAFLVVGLESMALVVAERCDKVILRFPDRGGYGSDLPIPGEVVTSPERFRKRLDYYVRKHLKGTKALGKGKGSHSGR